MTKIAFVIPLDVNRHIQYATNLRELASPVSDVYVILTEDADRQFSFDPAIKILVLADWVPREVIDLVLKNRSMPTFKKWWGMDHILREQQYAFFVACDSEIKLVKPLDQEFVDDLPSQFNFVGDHFSEINMHGAPFLRAVDAIIPLPEDRRPCDRIYTWWSGLPVYSTETLEQFLQDMGIRDLFKLATWLRFDIFDHLIYQRWLVIKGFHGAKYICLTHDLKVPVGWSLEHQLNAEVYRLSQQAGLKTLWTTQRVYQRDQQSTKGVYILYHLDH